MKQIDKEVRMLLTGIIKKRENAMKNSEIINEEDLLGLMMESNMKEKIGNGKSNIGMTTDELITECKLFYFAGQESTSVLLTWTLVVLSMHPDWQDKARQEVYQHFGKNKPDFDGLSRLKIVSIRMIILCSFLQFIYSLCYLKPDANLAYINCHISHAW
jgi:cytochrome P450